MHVSLLPAFADNYIFALALDGGVVVVDPGSAEVVQAHLDACGEPLLAMLITHHHPDHLGGLAQLASRWPRARRIGPADPRIGGLDEIVDEGANFEVGGTRFEVLRTPGHTHSHLVYRSGMQLFCGDVLFSLGCGRIFEGTPAQMLDSLDRIASLPPQTRIWCAHEYTLSNARFALAVDPHNAALVARAAAVQALRELGLPSIPAALADECRCNPFLRCDDAAVAAAVRRHAGRELAGRIEVFAALREWKNAC